MRIPLTLTAVLFASAAGADVPQTAPLPEQKPAITAPSPALAAPGNQVCSDRIHEIRAERGLPKLDERSAGKPLMILAVDKRIGGCSFMVMAYDANDIRPVPTQSEPAKLRKIQ